MTESLRLLGGVLLLAAGVATVITAVFRSLGDNWPLQRHEWWALPVTGVGLITLGRWLLS